MKRLIGLYLLAMCAVAAADDKQYLSYDDFIRHVETGLIVSVELDSYSQLQGTMRVDDGERAFRSFADTGSANDPLLIRLLREHDVAVTMQPEIDPDFGFGWEFSMGFVMLAMPFAILAILVLAFLSHNKLIRVLAYQERLAATPQREVSDSLRREIP